MEGGSGRVGAFGAVFEGRRMRRRISAPRMEVAMIGAGFRMMENLRLKFETSIGELGTGVS